MRCNLDQITPFERSPIITRIKYLNLLVNIAMFIVHCCIKTIINRQLRFNNSKSRFIVMGSSLIA